MEKEFIPYEEALALKELGFDEDCILCYRGGAIYSDGEIGGWKENWSFSKNSDYKRYTVDEERPQHWVAAPTYSQAFRWFREEKRLFAGFEYSQNQNSVNWNIMYMDGFESISSRKYNNHKGKNTGAKLTEKINEARFAEAELDCLRKLIGIVKSNQK